MALGYPGFLGLCGRKPSVRVARACLSALEVQPSCSPACAGRTRGRADSDQLTARGAGLSHGALLARAAALPHEPGRTLGVAGTFLHPADVRRLLFAVVFPIGSRSGFASGKLLLLFDLNSILLPIVFSLSKRSSVAGESKITIKYKNTLGGCHTGVSIRSL